MGKIYWKEGGKIMKLIARVAMKHEWKKFDTIHQEDTKRTFEIVKNGRQEI